MKGWVRAVGGGGGLELVESASVATVLVVFVTSAMPDF